MDSEFQKRVKMFYPNVHINSSCKPRETVQEVSSSALAIKYNLDQLWQWQYSGNSVFQPCDKWW